MSDFTHFIRTNATTHVLFSVGTCQQCGCMIRNVYDEGEGMIEGVTDQGLIDIGLIEGIDVVLPNGSICVNCNDADRLADMMDTGMDEESHRWHHAREMERAMKEENEHEAMLNDREDQFRDDVEADADALASAGFGTDEDYGGGRDEGECG